MITGSYKGRSVALLGFHGAGGPVDLPCLDHVTGATVLPFPESRKIRNIRAGTKPAAVIDLAFYRRAALSA